MTHLQIEPARAKAKKPDDLWDHPMWVAEEKLNGWRFLTHLGGDLDRVYMTGRRQSSRTLKLSEKGLCAPQLWPQIDFSMIDYTVIDGEVLSPTGDPRDVAGIMNVSPVDAAKRILEIGPPRYVAWDALFIDGEDLREKCLADRRESLRCLWPSINHDLLTIVESRADKRAFYDEIVKRGGEGVVLKDLASAYGESGAWVKVKRAPTVDLVVTGFHAAKIGVTGKYLGQVGSLLVSAYGADGRTLIEVARVSGMTDEERRDMTDNPGRWLGAVVECEAQEFAKDRLQHPRFVRRREDVDPKTCTFSKMLHDLGAVGMRREPEQLSLL